MCNDKSNQSKRRERMSEEFAAWCRSVEEALGQLTAQVRGLAQAQATRTPPKAPQQPQQTQQTQKQQRGGEAEAVVVVAEKGSSEAEARRLELRRRVLQCELEDLTDENTRLRARIRELMLAQRDANLTGVMLVALVLLAASVLYRLFAARHPRHHAPDAFTTPHTAHTARTGSSSERTEL